MATRRRFVSTSAGMILMSVAAAELALLPGCGGSGLGDDDDDAASPTPTPDVTGGILTVSLADHPALADADGFITFNVAGTRIIIAHVDAGATYVCLSSVCTHQGCGVSFAGGANTFNCPCHGSQFSTTGAVLAGPAPTALRSYPTTFDGTTVVVDLN